MSNPSRVAAPGPRLIAAGALAVAASVFCLAMGAAIASEDARLSLRELASAYGFSSTQVDELLAGEVVFGKLRSVSDSELALSAGLYSKRTVDWHVSDSVRLPVQSNPAEPTLVARGVLVGDGRSSLAKLTVDDATLDKLAKIEAGGDGNFSSAEIATLREAGSNPDPSARRAAVLEAFREVLAGRYASYRDRGMSGLAPYDRGKGKTVSPADQLERAFAELRLTRELVPRTHAAMANYPAPVPEDVTSRFVWEINSAEDRTLVFLEHQVVGVESEHLVWINRRFYVDHTLNSMQAVSVFAPLDDGSAVLYSNRTSTDLVTGFGSSVAKKIGRALMRREIGRLAEAFRNATEG